MSILIQIIHMLLTKIHTPFKIQKCIINNSKLVQAKPTKIEMFILKLFWCFQMTIFETYLYLIPRVNKDITKNKAKRCLKKILTTFRWCKKITCTQKRRGWYVSKRLTTQLFINFLFFRHLSLLGAYFFSYIRFKLEGNV